MLSLNRLSYPFPYFISKENQTLYVMVPSANPMVFKHSYGNIGKIRNLSTEEEILPDFKCEKCSVRILTYSELKFHQQDHKKSEEEKLNKSHLLGNHHVEGLGSTNCVLKSNNSENLKDGSNFHHLKCGSDLNTTKTINPMSNKVFSSETASNPLHEEDKRYLSSNRMLASFKNSNFIVHNLEMSDCSKSFVGGSSPEDLYEKGIRETIDNFSDFTTTNQPVSKYSYISKCKTYTEKNGRYRAIKQDYRRSLKMSASQATKVNEHSVYIREPLNNAEEKPFRCIYCRKTFESRFHMRKHLLEHKETKTDFCAICCLFFARIETFRKHLLIFHCQAKDEKQCPYCDYRYFRQTNFENHIASSHATAGYLKNKCKNCLQEFETVKDLNNHIAREHFNRNFDV